MAWTQRILVGLAVGFLGAGMTGAQTKAPVQETEQLPPGAVMRLGSPRLRHTAWVQSVSFSFDSRRVAAADSSQIVRIWDVATGKKLRELPGKPGTLVAWSPTEELLATAGYYEQQITFWNPTTGERLRELKQNARSIAFSSDGKRLAAAGSDGIVRLWNVADGALVREFKGHEGALFAVTISHDGKTIASGGGGDGTAANKNEVRLWNAETGEGIAEFEEDEGMLKGLKGWIYDLDFSPDDKTLAVATPYAVRIWDVPRRKQLHRLEKSANAVRFAPDENRLAVAGDFAIYDALEGNEILKLADDLRKTQTSSLDYSPSGALIATGDHEGRVRLWDARRGEELLRGTGHRQGITAVAFSPDGTIATSLSRGDSTIRVWGMQSGALLRTIDVEWTGSDVYWNREGWELFFPDYGRDVVTWSYNGTWHFHELARRDHRKVEFTQRSKANPGDYGTMVGGTLSRDGTRAALVAYGGSQPKVRCYTLDGEALLAEINPFAASSSSDSWITALAFSPDGKQLALGVRLRDKVDDTIQLWDVEKGKLIRSFRRDENAPGQLVFSRAGELLASAATGYTPVQVWRVGDGKELHRVNEKDKNRSWYEWSPLAFSPDGHTLATATKEREIVVWELATNTATARFKGHEGAVQALAFSPSGKHLLSGGADAALVLWEVQRAKRAAVELDEAKLKNLWLDLAGNDAGRADAALAALAGAPQASIPFLRVHLKSVADPAVADLPGLIAGLDDADEAKRAAAVQAITQYGAAASPALFKALATASPLARDEIERLLEVIDEFPIPAAELQRTRGIQLLERIGTADAQALLKSLAAAPESSATAREAQACLDRLKGRRNSAKSYVEEEEKE